MRKERPVARNVFGLALLMTVGLAGCSLLKGDREAQEAEAKMVALRARTDSLRKARHAADSLAQVRYTACADSVRGVMTKPQPVVKAKTKAKTRTKKRPAVTAPSEEMIVMQVQSACAEGAVAPGTTVATAVPPRTAVPAVKPPQTAVPAAEPPRTAVPVADRPQTTVAAAEPAVIPTKPDSTLPRTQDAVWEDSVRKARETEVSRETFAYSGAARDPFVSLLNIGKNGPELADLQLVGVYHNLRTPTGSVAVFREKSGGKRHKLRAGEQVGRSRLVQIRERDVVFMIEDFGFERQETLSLRKQEDVIP
jgi:hypothetical protein